MAMHEDVDDGMALGRTKHLWEYMDVFGGQGIRVMVVIEKNGCWCLPIGVEGRWGECEGIESITIKIFADISGQATIGKELRDNKLTITSYQALFELRCLCAPDNDDQRSFMSVRRA